MLSSLGSHEEQKPRTQLSRGLLQSDALSQTSRPSWLAEHSRTHSPR